MAFSGQADDGWKEKAPLREMLPMSGCLRFGLRLRFSSGVRRLRSSLRDSRSPWASFPSVLASWRKRSSPEDLVRLYDSIISTLQEMGQLDGYKEHESLMGQLASRVSIAKAYRCYFVAESYGSAEKWRESLALLDRASDLLEEAARCEAVDRVRAGRAVVEEHGVLSEVRGAHRRAERQLELRASPLREAARARHAAVPVTCF